MHYQYIKIIKTSVIQSDIYHQIKLITFIKILFYSFIILHYFIFQHWLHIIIMTTDTIIFSGMSLVFIK